VISDLDRAILTDPWPYRFTYIEYEEARRRNGLGVGLRGPLTRPEDRTLAQVRFDGAVERATTPTITELFPAPPLRDDMRPMSTAPRDGTHITVRRKPHPNMRHHIGIVYWVARTISRGFWSGFSAGNSIYGQDDDFIGWWDEEK